MSGDQSISQYIHDVCQQIKHREIHQTIILELENHFAEKIADYREGGFEEEEAVRLAIADMGDPITVGKQLHQAHKPRMEWGIVTMFAVLLGIGMLTIFSLHASFDNSSWIVNKFVGILIGTLVFASILFADYSKLKKYSRGLYWGTLALLMVTMFQGHSIAGTIYLDLRFMTVPFGELSVFLFAIAMTGIFSAYNWSDRYAAWKAFAYFLPFYVVLAFNQQLFAAILLVTTFPLLLLASSAKRRTRFIILGLMVACIGGNFYFFADQYTLDWLLTPIHPYDQNGNEYLDSLMLKELRSSAGLWGHGFGSHPTPEIANYQTNYVFSYVIYCFGWIAGVTLFIIGLLLTSRMIRAIKQVKDAYGSMLLAGIASLVFLPYFWAMLMAMGLLPLLSLNLPFISHGNTYLILNMALMGLALNIYRRKDIQPLVQA
ncbi:hypothetical protein AV540_22240 [Brevibacillus parabrevis]|uniref:FtsW/RodA/SpoVE family cell cycle protein n=1 Tax=Brevibacillus parabrevis TaxID=54914 RepID=UPI0007AC1AF9|nr:FtsW/RodA/SpoVE family cell cycle protein [Brevibacillus parabrevis]KZE46675.1 hypothetical protein AV540_22240 [Brevibacillus parabrevis]